MPDKACCGRLPDFEQAHAGTRGQCGRPPPLATPRYVGHDAKCVSAGQVRCRCAVERAPRTVRSPISTRESELDSIMTASPLKPSQFRSGTLPETDGPSGSTNLRSVDVTRPLGPCLP